MLIALLFRSALLLNTLSEPQEVHWTQSIITLTNYLCQAFFWREQGNRTYMEVIEWDKKAERQKVYLMRNNKATSKGDQPGSESRALQILALIGPVAAVVASRYE